MMMMVMMRQMLLLQLKRCLCFELNHNRLMKLMRMLLPGLVLEPIPRLERFLVLGRLQ